ncbi:hypothetical protein FB451DRAFT_1191458 [Mycena latifolia]|nr:hypothetical protein FB451DRAFT_1191458 [Mycena latifolia]
MLRARLQARGPPSQARSGPSQAKPGPGLNRSRSTLGLLGFRFASALIRLSASLGISPGTRNVTNCDCTRQASRSSFHITVAPRGSRDNPDPTLIVTSSRRKGPSDLLNAEPAIAVVEALVGRIGTLSRSLPTTIAAATKQDKIYHAMM